MSSGIVFPRGRNNKKYFLGKSTEARPFEAKVTGEFIYSANEKSTFAEHLSERRKSYKKYNIL